MKQNINIEAEGSELVLKNKAGDYVIIPKNKRTKVKELINQKNHKEIDTIVDSLPVMADYAQDGSLYIDNQIQDPPENKFITFGSNNEDKIGLDSPEVVGVRSIEYDEELARDKGKTIEKFTPTTNREDVPEEYRRMTNKALDLIRTYDMSNQELFEDINRNSGGACLAGALNCGTKSDDNESFGYLQDFTPNYPSLRSYLNKGDIAKYRTKDLKTDNELVPNLSIDAWEIHDYLRGEKLGTALFDDTEFTYTPGQPVPNEIFKDENYKKIPVGTIIGQADVNNRAQQRGYNKENNLSGRNRHSMIVVGYDKKDGMPIIYDSGHERRLDGVRYRNLGRITNFTVPNEYSNLTYGNIEEYSKYKQESLGWKKGDEINFESNKPHVKAVERGINSSAVNISKHYNLPKSAIKKIAKVLPGITNKETKFNNNEGMSADNKIPTSISDSYIGNKVAKPLAKATSNMISSAINYFSGESKEAKQDWELEIEAYKKYGKDEEKRNAYLSALQAENGESKGYATLESSVGAFKIKDLSEYAKKIGLSKEDLYGVTVNNEKELEKGAEAALSLLAEKYKFAEKKYKDMELTEDQLTKLAVIGYANGSKLNSRKFVEYYIKNDTGLTDEYYEDIVNYNPKNND